MKNLKIILIGLAVICLFMLSSFAGASNTFAYTVKAGDKQSYKLSKFDVGGKTSITGMYTLTDGTQTNITVKQGDSFTIQICNVTTSLAYIQLILQGKTVQCQQALGVYINQVTSNKTYYSDLASQNSTAYQLSGTTFTNNTGYTNTGVIYDTSISYDITTGWSTQLNMTYKYTNGTIIVQEIINASGKSSPGFEVTSLLIAFTILVPVVLLYRKRKAI